VTLARSIAWPPYHPRGPSRRSDHFDHLQFARDDFRIRAVRLAGQVMKRLREQAIASENGHPLAGDHVERGLAPAHGVVIHRRQIVVDQRVGVDELDRARGRQGHRAIAADGVGACQTQHRTQPLAACEQAVRHRITNDLWAG
jgi:hypothetical protein